MKPHAARILVVDDRRENLFAMEKLLEPLEIDVFTAESGNEALSLMLHHDFAVALLDVQMPEMDGLELAALMRDNEHTDGIPIVFVTAMSHQAQNVFAGYGAGAVDYLFKPIEPEIVMSKVRVFCELYGQRKALEAEIEAHKRAREENEGLIGKLRGALEQIKRLHGMIPICGHCKKVRNDDGCWDQVEVYMRAHSEAEFSHSICPECMAKLDPASGGEAEAAGEDVEKRGDSGGTEGSKAHGRGTIVVVDDEEALCKLIAAQLKRLEYTVLCAASGRKAIGVFREHAGETVCVLLDLNMPELDGEETFEALRAIRPAIRVILMSGYDEEELCERFAGRGFAGFLHKPFTSSTLKEKLAEVLT